MASRSSSSPRLSKEQLKNLEEGKVFLFMPRLAPCFNINNPKGRSWAENEIKAIWRPFGDVKQVTFRTVRGGGEVGQRGYISAFVLFEGDFDTKALKRIKKKGKISLKKALRVPRNWDYDRGDPLTEWRYDALPSNIPPLSEEDLAKRRKKRWDEKNQAKMVFSSDEEDDDDESDSDSDDE